MTILRRPNLEASCAAVEQSRVEWRAARRQSSRILLQLGLASVSSRVRTARAMPVDLLEIYWPISVDHERSPMVCKCLKWRKP